MIKIVLWQFCKCHYTSCPLLPSLLPIPVRTPCFPQMPLTFPSVHFVLWPTVFPQAHLGDHGFGAVSWSLVGSEMRTQLSTTVCPLPECISSAVRGEVPRATPQSAALCWPRSGVQYSCEFKMTEVLSSLAGDHIQSLTLATGSDRLPGPASFCSIRKEPTHKGNQLSHFEWVLPFGRWENRKSEK